MKMRNGVLMVKKPSNLPEVIELTENEVEDIIKQIKESSLDEKTKRITIKSIELSMWLPDVLQSKTISLHRLRRSIFGKGYKLKAGSKTPKDPQNGDTKPSDLDKNTQQDDNAPVEQDGLHENSQQVPLSKEPENKDKIPGHGRLPYTAYADCEEVVKLSISGLKAGDFCPEQCGGRLSQYSPGNIIRVKGQNFSRVLHYEVEKLRCNLCNLLIVADIPAEVGNEKYDAAFKAIMVLQKYYVGVPFYRQENFQALLKMPLSDATQWGLVEDVAGCCMGIFAVLKSLAANGHLLHNDDTHLKILEHIKAIKNEVAERVGMFTTGIFAQYEEHVIALFLNGTRHSGENLEELLKLREEDKPELIQMCDGSSQNIPRTFKTIVCNCLSHGFRKFEDLYDYYPAECVEVMKYISDIYDIDEKTVEMSAQERLEYHQQHSQPIVDALFSYMEHLKEARLVEPNGELCGAINYMLKRKDKITRFLEVAGAPLDNNILERALKLPIRLRKASLFYRTNRSAEIGGMLTSLIYTCQLARKNPQHYFVALQAHHVAVSKAPSQWLPWNYEEALKALDSS